MGEFLKGKISYRGPHGETGREWFEMVEHEGGLGRTLRAFCEMDEIALTRDVTMLLDPASRPLDGFCRVTRQGARAGTVLFVCEVAGVRASGDLAQGGRLAQHLPVPSGVEYLGLHSLVGDALIALARGTDAPGTFRAIACVTNSISPDGDKGLVAMPTAIEVAYRGEESVSTAAGTFAARRYCLRWHPAWEPADLWVHGPHALFLRLEWAMVGASYELVELQSGR